MLIVPPILKNPQKIRRKSGPCHLSPDHHSMQLHLVWKTQEVWWCSCGRFCHLVMDRVKKIKIKFGEKNSFTLYGISSSTGRLHSPLLKSYKEEKNRQTDTQISWLIDWIGLGADSVKTSPPHSLLFLWRAKLYSKCGQSLGLRLYPAVTVNSYQDGAVFEMVNGLDWRDMIYHIYTFQARLIHSSINSKVQNHS